MVVRKILTKDPVHRDWTLFASNGMGMVLFMPCRSFLPRSTFMLHPFLQH